MNKDKIKSLCVWDYKILLTEMSYSIWTHETKSPK